MLNVLICDNDLRQLETTKGYINQALAEMRIERGISCFADPSELMTYLDITGGNADILFMTIGLPGETGIEIAKKINIMYPHIKIIFISDEISHATEIFKANPTYFLLKPIIMPKLYNALEAAVNDTDRTAEDTIVFSQKGKLLNVRKRLIDYAVSSGRIVTIYEGNRSVEIYTKLCDVESRLGSIFLRCHQSYIVNMERIRSFERTNIELYSGIFVPVSKKRYSLAKSEYLKYIKANH